jgi:HK97 family phage major capsid protein
MNFARAAIALAKAGGKSGPAQALARNAYGDGSLPERIIKAAVGATTAADIGADVNGAMIEFMSAVREQTVLGKIQLLRRRPLRTRYLVNTTATPTGNWVGETAAIPVLRLAFEQATLDALKVATIVVLTDESIDAAASDPAAEAGIRQDLIDGLAVGIDTAFLDPANAGVAGEQPASVTHGLTPVAVAGGTEEDIRDGFATLIDQFEGDLTRSVFVARPELYAYLNGLGYDKVGIRGGELLGAPAIASNGIPNAGGFYQLALIDPRGISYVDDPTATQVTASKEAALEMRDDPVGNAATPTAANLVSLFQCNCTALKALAYANWSVEQTGAVALMATVPVADVS